MKFHIHNRRFTHPYRPHVLLLCRLRLAAELLEEPVEEVIHALGRRDDVEGRGRGAALLEIAYPEFAASELPLRVRPLLAVGDRG